MRHIFYLFFSTLRFSIPSLINISYQHLISYNSQSPSRLWHKSTLHLLSQKTCKNLPKVMPSHTLNKKNTFSPYTHTANSISAAEWRWWAVFWWAAGCPGARGRIRWSAVCASSPKRENSERASEREKGVDEFHVSLCKLDSHWSSPHLC